MLRAARRGPSQRIAARQVLGALWWAKLGGRFAAEAALALVLLYASLSRLLPPPRSSAEAVVSKWHAYALTPIICAVAQQRIKPDRHLCNSSHIAAQRK